MNAIVLGVGVTPQAIVVLLSGVMVGNAAGNTVIVRETGASSLAQGSIAVQVSVIVPPHEPGAGLKVDGLDEPTIAHEPLSPLLKLRVLDAGIAPQATEILAGAVIVGNGAGVTVTVLNTGTNALPQESIAVQVSVIVPPHPPGGVPKVDGFDRPITMQFPLKPFE